MEKPKCKLCGERHWGACQYTVRVKAAADNPGPVTINGIPITRAGAPIMAGDLIPGQIARFDRNAYQRDYMRKRRAAAKAKRP